MKRELLYLTASNLSSNILIAATNIILASILTPSDYATTRIAASYTFILLLLSHFSMYDSICGKLRESNIPKNNTLIKTACIMSLVLSTFCVIAFATYSYFFSHWTQKQAQNIILIVACVIILAPATIISNTLQLRADNTTFAQYQMSNGLSQFIFGTSLSYLIGITGWALSRSINAALGLWVCSRKYISEISRTSLVIGDVYRLLKTSIFHVISGICSIFVLCGDILLLDWANTSNDKIGAYGLAATLCKASYFLPNILGRYRMAYLIGGDSSIQHERCNSYKKIIFLIGIGSAIAIYSSVYLLCSLDAFGSYPELLHFTLLCSFYTPLAFYWTAIYTTNIAKGVNAGFAYQGIAAASGMLVFFLLPKPISTELNVCLAVIAGYVTGIATYYFTQPKETGNKG